MDGSDRQSRLPVVEHVVKETLPAGTTMETEFEPATGTASATADFHDALKRVVKSCLVLKCAPLAWGPTTSCSPLTR
jgi:hypothetical protein